METKQVYHKTKQGVKIKIEDMTDSHLKSMIKMINRYAENGMVMTSGGGNDPDSFFIEQEHLEGKEVKDYFNLKKYEAELKRRAK